LQIAERPRTVKSHRGAKNPATWRRLFPTYFLVLPQGRPEQQQVLRFINAYSSPIYPDELDESRTYNEGAKRRVTVNAYERDERTRAACIKFYGTQCAVCDFDFGEFYGKLGEGFVHGHHLRDLATVGDNYEVDPIKDLRPVCPNCHAMLHREAPAMQIEALRSAIDQERRNKDAVNDEGS